MTHDFADVKAFARCEQDQIGQVRRRTLAA
jgi:hypothetical protein